MASFLDSGPELCPMTRTQQPFRCLSYAGLLDPQIGSCPIAPRQNARQKGYTPKNQSCAFPSDSFYTTQEKRISSNTITCGVPFLFFLKPTRKKGRRHKRYPEDPDLTFSPEPPGWTQAGSWTPSAGSSAGSSVLGSWPGLGVEPRQAPGAVVQFHRYVAWKSERVDWSEQDRRFFWVMPLK